MKKLILLLFVLFLGLTGTQAQTFKPSKGFKIQMQLTWYGQAKSDRSGYVWQKDVGDMTDYETWTLWNDYSMGIRNNIEVSNVGSYKYYSSSDDGKTLYIYSDKAKTNLVNTLQMYNSMEENIGYTVGTIDKNNIVRVFYFRTKTESLF